MYSVSTLGNLQVQDALPLIIEALKDNHELVREHAARALVKLSNLAALEPLLAALKDEKSDVRYNVALALGQLGDKRALPALKQLQKDKNLTSYRVEVREAAIEAIRNIQEQNR
jgi:HEAT repeat protein